MNYNYSISGFPALLAFLITSACGSNANSPAVDSSAADSAAHDSLPAVDTLTASATDSSPFDSTTFATSPDTGAAIDSSTPQTDSSDAGFDTPKADAISDVPIATDAADTATNPPVADAVSDDVTPTTTLRAQCTSVPVGKTANAGDPMCPGGGPGPNCFECLFGGPESEVATLGPQEAGNYAVTVKIGGAAAGTTEIHAETYRTLLGPVTTTAGQFLSYQFNVNVRAREGQPDELGQAPYGNPGLDIFFSGPSATPPEVSAIGYALDSAAGDPPPVVIYIASDSTACDQSDPDYAGWGQMLPMYFDYPADIANYADSGESSGSFLNGSDRWGATGIMGNIAKGDWVLIQFGHNDGNTSSAQFQANETAMVTQAKAKGANPVLVSPPARATFSGSTLSDQSSLHAADAQAVAKAQNVPFIDLTAITTNWYNTVVGPNGWEAYHAMGTSSRDKTHTNAAGATKIAGFVASAIGTQNIGLAKYLR